MKILAVLMFGILLVGCSATSNKEEEENSQQADKARLELIEERELAFNAHNKKIEKPPEKKKIEYQLVGTKVKSMEDPTPDISIIVACQIKRNSSGKISSFEISMVNSTKEPITFNYFMDDFFLYDKNKAKYNLKKPDFTEYPASPEGQRYVNPGDGARISILPNPSVSELKDSDIELFICSFEAQKTVLVMAYGPRSF